MTHGIRFRLARFARWLFGSPFLELPPAFGNTIPPELQIFEAEAAEAGRRGWAGLLLPCRCITARLTQTPGILDGASVAAAA